MHGLLEIDRVQNFQPVVIAEQYITALGNDTALWICYNKTGRVLFGCALEQVRLQPEAGFAGATTTDDKNILIPGGFGICGL